MVEERIAGPDAPTSRSTEPPSGRISRAEQRERSRASILTTAVRLFGQRGFAGVSIDELAAEAGVRRSLLLYYHNSKDALWQAAAAHVSAAFNARLTDKLAHADRATDEDRMRATLNASLDAYLEEPDYARFLVREGGAEGPKLRYLIDRFNYADIRYNDPELGRLLDTSILRDMLFAIFLSMAALGPLMEVSLSRVSGRKRAGVHPMSRANRRELVALLTRFMMSVGSGKAADGAD